MIVRVRTLFAAPGIVVAGLLTITAVLLTAPLVSNARNGNDRLITVYDRGTKTSFLTQANTLDKALEQAHITLDPRDTVEPSRTEELIASEYKVNIYRARPVVVVDGAVRTKIITPYQTADRIAKDVGITIYPEDIATIQRSSDLVADGAGLRLTINRAVPFILDLYGRRTETRTHASSVAGMLREKGIKLGDNDRVSAELTTVITPGSEIRVWREGRQTTAVDEPIPFSKAIIYDADRPLGYRAVQTPGVEGVRTISYEIEIKDGNEIARTEIARIITKQPGQQVTVIGIKDLSQGLTNGKGALFHTDSKGVVHRETYYDLNMRVVMYACGQGGAYSVRFDGMKIDSDGYVIIAANYARYPKCSVVETSVGPGKVYDTGGFVSRYPDGFDLATDWSQADGI